ncbi:acetyltransferase [Flavobacterium sp. KS-LB2]|uniref:acetyltransferase n=1 Tax=Flavobacterium sp. KS-LB2 TaxID=3120525 RepID=UPI0030D412D1
MKKKQTILAGYSGHGFVVAEAAMLANIKIDGYLEPDVVAHNYFDLKYMGFELNPDFDWTENYEFILGIGDNELRNRLGKLILSKGKNVLNITHPAASVSRMITFGNGNLIARHASINPLVTIGNFCIVNTAAILEHECKIGNAVHIGPGAVLCGNVQIGENTFIGANSVIKQGIKIGKNVIIGAGSVIITDVNDNLKVVGNPGKII